MDKLHWILAVAFAALYCGSVSARNCDYFFYAGTPLEVYQYKVTYIKKEVPDSYFTEVPRPISKGSDLAIEWSKQAADCLLNPRNGILAGFEETKTLTRMQTLKRSLDDLSMPYEGDSLFETRRINQALKKNLEEFKRSVTASEPTKVDFLRGILIQSCSSFESIATNVGIITALKLPIELRKGYIRDFCGKEQEASRAETIAKLEEIEIQCNNGSIEACDLKDVFDSVDCSRVDEFLAQDFDGIINRFVVLSEKIKETRNDCAYNIKSLIDTCMDLGLGRSSCLIPTTEAGACQRLEIDNEYCSN